MENSFRIGKLHELILLKSEKRSLNSFVKAAHL